jgi:hypothetical protein
LRPIAIEGQEALVGEHVKKLDHEEWISALHLEKQFGSSSAH